MKRDADDDDDDDNDDYTGGILLVLVLLLPPAPPRALSTNFPPPPPPPPQKLIRMEGSPRCKCSSSYSLTVFLVTVEGREQREATLRRDIAVREPHPSYDGR